MATDGEVWNSNLSLKPIFSSECLETVRVLHRTIVSLRKALEKSQREIHLLKSRIRGQEIDSKYSNLVEQLALENYVLKHRILPKKNPSPMERSSNLLPDDETEEEGVAKTECQEVFEVSNFSKMYAIVNN